jgi:nucleoside 2-deoxyribosyltransferase
LPRNVELILAADAVLAIFDGADVGSGTAAEIRLRLLTKRRS